MTQDRILITGASGCVGQYTSHWLLKNTDSELILWLRDPCKLKSIDHNHPRVKLLIGDLREPNKFSKELNSVTHLIHTATAWGDIERTNQVNIIAVKKLLSFLDSEKVKLIIYFSTASILNKNLEQMPEALNYGTEYIQSKSKCLNELEKHKLSNKIIAVFPTLVFGGKYDNSGRFPSSYLTQGITTAINWMWLARWFRLHSKFHFIHAKDIAYVCGQLIKGNELKSLSAKSSGGIRKLVLGQPYLSVNQATRILLRWIGMRKLGIISLRGWLIEALINILPIHITSWDRFSIKQKNFIHEPVTSPEDFGGESYAKTLEEILIHSGLPKGKKSY